MRNWKAEVRSRLVTLDLPAPRIASIAEEVGQHLEDRHLHLLTTGVTDDEADRLLLQELSESDVLKREVTRLSRDGNGGAPAVGAGGGGSWIDSFRHDVRYGLRTLRRSPGFSLVAATTLSLGIGASTAIFTVANTVMFRPLPFHDPQRLVRLWESNAERGWPTFSASQPNFLDWRDQNHSFERLAAQSTTGFTLTSQGGAEIVRAITVTADFLPVLGIAPSVGRNFRADEDRPGGRTTVAILMHEFWQRRFGADPAVVGTSVTLDGRPFDIIGVLPPSFRWGNRTDLLVPLAPDPARSRADHRLLTIGRLAPDVSIDQARAEMNGVASTLAKQFPETNRGWSVRISTFYDWLVPEENRKAIVIFMGAVGLVLLIACGNVASLMLARAASREKEISIRAALGASRLRIVSQLLVEAMLVALAAGALGLLVTWGATRLLTAAGPAVGLPRLDEISIDMRVFGFALAIALLSGLCFGVLPALHASRAHLNSSLKETARGSTDSASQQRLRSALIVAEVALSVSLLVGAGLLVRSFLQLQRVDPGFQLDHLATMRVNLPRTTYDTSPKSKAFYDRLLPALAALPGVQSVATSSGVPLAGGNTSTELSVPGRPIAKGVPASADWRLVSPGYFKAMNIPLRGRDFDDRDVGTADKLGAVTIISASTARRYWPGEDPIGRSVILHSFGETPQMIIGVAGDVRSLGLDSDVGALTVYGSAAADPGWNPMSLVVRSSVDPLSHVTDIRSTLREIDPAVPLFDVRALDDLLSDSFGSRRFNMYLLGCFATAAAVLSCVGLFGVLAYLVAQRTRDIGIRLALGAGRRDVIAMIVGRGMTLALAGAVLGLIAAFGAARLMKSLLFSVAPWDPLTFAAVPALVCIVALIACYVPAQRASRVDPLSALRSE
jgi:putative ABC transport system permease protein